MSKPLHWGYFPKIMPEMLHRVDLQFAFYGGAVAFFKELIKIQEMPDVSERAKAVADLKSQVEIACLQKAEACQKIRRDLAPLLQRKKKR